MNRIYAERFPMPYPSRTSFGVAFLWKGAKVQIDPDSPNRLHADSWPNSIDDSVARKDRFSWLILKAHTDNDDGRVSLRSADPLERQLAADWDPETDTHRPAWESVHQLIRAQDEGGDEAVAALDPVAAVAEGPAASQGDARAASEARHPRTAVAAS